MDDPVFAGYFKDIRDEIARLRFLSLIVVRDAVNVIEVRLNDIEEWLRS